MPRPSLLKAAQITKFPSSNVCAEVRACKAQDGMAQNHTHSVWAMLGIDMVEGGERAA